MLRDKILGTRHKENDQKWNNANFLVSDSRKSVSDWRFLTTSPKQFLRRTIFIPIWLRYFMNAIEINATWYFWVFLYILFFRIILSCFKYIKVAKRWMATVWNCISWIVQSDCQQPFEIRWFVKILFGYTLLNWYSVIRRYILNLISHYMLICE